ncbi:DUF2971 domain-containing protein [uncultured Corynebacterium sp.]|uniref:DUF2971 domain-containing protein n=1 Tax=uncultured Corynebacterium sp. TaxID=159447 RepID=UPI002805B939|nr:DUF2971 domain-containing protein [uncultured Corynebacterium sp.]
MLLRIPTTEAVLEGIVWHYTDVQGFKGIIESEGLWATNADFLNDPTELKYGVELLIERLSERLAEEKQVEEQANLKYILEVFRDASGFFESQTSQFYLLSASVEGDSLNQWAHYAGGGGVAVGICAQYNLQIVDRDRKLVPFTLGNSEYGKLGNPCYISSGWRKVLYDPDRQINQLDELINFYLRPMRNETLSESAMDAKEKPSKTVEDFWTSARLVCSYLKHPSFKDEREVRAIYHDYRGDLSHFRATQKSIVPYLETRFGSVPVRGEANIPHLSHVRLGPGATKKEIRATKEFLKARGFNSTMVTMSVSPYLPSR